MQLPHGAHVGAEYAQLAMKNKAHIDSHLRSGGSAARDQRTARCERLEAVFPGRQSDVLYDNVDARAVRNLSDLLRDVLLVMIDDMVGAKFPSLGHLLLRSCRGNHCSLKQLRHLDSRNSHS